MSEWEATAHSEKKKKVLCLNKNLHVFNFSSISHSIAAKCSAIVTCEALSIWTHFVAFHNDAVSLFHFIIIFYFFLRLNDNNDDDVIHLK